MIYSDKKLLEIYQNNSIKKPCNIYLSSIVNYTDLNIFFNGASNAILTLLWRTA